MAFIGAGLKVSKGLARKAELKSQIENLKLLNDNPVLDFYEGEQRLIYALDICEAIILHYVDATNELSSDYSEILDLIAREYQMSQDKLSNETASKAQVYALGLAIKELSLSNDADKNQLNNEIKLLKEQLDKNSSRLNNVLILAVIAIVIVVINVALKI